MRFLILLLLPTLCNAGYLTDWHLEKIRENWADYEYAAELTGIPVEILPAIHYRESALYKGYYSKKRKTVTKNVGGPFMLDFGGKGEEFVQRIRDHEKIVFELYGGVGKVPKISHDFRFACLVAAHHLKLKTRCSLDQFECLADAVWGYNGRASWHVLEEGEKPSHQNSAYCWSDPQNGTDLPVKYRDRQNIVREFMDTRPGVMVIYDEILILKQLGTLP